VRHLVLFALLFAGCGQQQAAVLTMDNAIGRMEDSALGSMRAFEAEKPKSCHSKNLEESEGAVTYAINVMTPATHGLSGAMAAGDWTLQAADAARRAGVRRLLVASTTGSCKTTLAQSIPLFESAPSLALAICTLVLRAPPKIA